MSFVDTLTNQRIYVDSDQNSGYTLRNGEFISSMPPLAPATLTGVQATEANQPRLVLGSPDLIVFDPSVTNQFLTFGNAGDIELGGGTTTPSFMIGIKFTINQTKNMELIKNDLAKRNFLLTVGNDRLKFNVKGSFVYLNDGTTSFENGYQTDILTGSHYFVTRINIDADPNNNTGDLIFDGDELNGLKFPGTDDHTGPFTLGQGLDGSIEKLVAVQDFGTLQQMRDLDSFLRGELDVLQYQVIRQGVAQSGVKVTWWQMDAFAANNITSGAFNNMVSLGSAVTDANGVASLDVSGIVAYDDTKVHYAAYGDAFYRVSDSKWLLPPGFSARNIDMSPPI